MKQSVTDTVQFRELDGAEASLVIARRVQSDVLEALDLAENEALGDEFLQHIIKTLKGTGKYDNGSAFPVVVFEILGRVKVLPNEKDPKPHQFMLTHEVFRKHEIGTSTETAVDKIREEVGLTVLQPQKTESGVVVNMPVK